MNIKPWFLFPEPDIDQYQVNYSGTCVLSWIADDGLCSIVDYDKLPLDYHLYKELVSGLKQLPPVNVVFAIRQDEHRLFRAVRAVEPIGSTHQIRLIDIGEEFAFDPSKNMKLYSITAMAQQDSSKAIPCRVIEVLDKKGAKMGLEDGLKYALFEKSVFTVKAIINGNLVVTLRIRGEEPSSEIESDSESEDEPLENELKLTDEQIRILYDDPETTTNALKAILGYVPHDEKRICPFYEESSGRCFKGNSCQLEHIKPLENGLTRDRCTVCTELVSQVMPLVGSRVKAYITWVLNINEFYIYIPRHAPMSLKAIKDKLNKKEHCEMYRKIKRFLGIHELVLVKCDGDFFRGRVLEVIEDDRTAFQVFLIDYGAVKIVPLGAVFEWNSFCDGLPALVYRCMLAHASMRYNDNKSAVKQVQNILSQQGELNVQIVESVDDVLYVNLLSANGIDLGEMFCKMGLTERTEQMIPVSGYICG